MDKKTRKDSWTVEDDKVLADTVLTFIREGKTQLQAFEETATILDRTKQACGFRWNKTLRKQYNLQKLSRTKKPNEIHDHLQLAMTSYDDLSNAYEKLKLDHEQLQSEYEKIKDWLLNGKELMRIE
ncbi:transcriptional regulator [Paenisporosarcina indica]|uniref:transcriptional regulator n=1 Tax=Paenisporosarcina indica TaxID=650093 RepID=UPI00094FB6C3|nr:transcriptional regulator [Paenisporosarcina indica]